MTAPTADAGQVATPDADSTRKTVATLQAVAAMAGVRVDPIEGDDGHTVYIVTRWALTKQCNTLDEMADLLRRMGVAA
jgi:hypothetical protein